MIDVNKYVDIQFVAKVTTAIVIGFGSLWITAAFVLFCIVIYKLLFVGQLEINGHPATPSEGWGFAAVIGVMMAIGIAAVVISIKLIRIGAKKHMDLAS